MVAVIFTPREGDDNGTLNMSQLMMKTLDRTANMFTAFRIPVSANTTANYVHWYI